MPNFSKTSWYSDGKQFVRKMDRWVSRSNLEADAGQETDWLGWDGWVKTDSDPKAKHDTPGMA